MGTRARIALQLPDKTIISAYQHWDGYPSKLGYQLCTWWRDPEKVEKGIRMGSASSWNFIIGQKVDFDDCGAPQNKVQNVYHHRDRNDPWEECQYEVHKTEAELLDDGFSCCEEYVYLMKNGLWYYADDEDHSDRFYPLWDRAINDHLEWLNRIKPQYPN